LKTVGFYTLGCKLNFSETSTLARQFAAQGYRAVPFHEPADVYVVNTCSVTAQADQKCRKVVRQALKRNAEAAVVVVGCYAQLKPREIAEIPGVDVVLGAAEKFALFDHLQHLEKQPQAKVLQGDICHATTFTAGYSLEERTRAFLKVQDGCDYKCSFCTIPLARGASRSDTPQAVLTNLNELHAAGVKEVVFTGVNLGDYGKDQTLDFLGLCQYVETHGPDIPRYRISSIEPNLLNNELIALVAASARFVPHFHMPLQSGNNEMLAAMRRRYRRELYHDRVHTIRQLMPDACLGVDVIVGFPGETDAHFEDTYQFLEALPVSYFHVFPYSERANTLAAEMPGSVPVPVRDARVERLRTLSDCKRAAFTAQYVGTRQRVLWEEAVTVEGNLEGWTDNYVRVATPYDPLLVNELTETDLMPGLRPDCLMGDPVVQPHPEPELEPLSLP
jgi:threonylcarbamoyladenosine tRNA methylthiotransferase MtaB